MYPALNDDIVARANECVDDDARAFLGLIKLFTERALS